MSADVVAQYIAFLDHDISVTLLPAAYFRWRMGAVDEHRIVSLIAATFVAFISYSIFSGGQGSWERLLVLTVVQAASFAIVKDSWRWTLVGILLLAAGATSVDAKRSRETGMVDFFTTSFGVATRFDRHGIAAVGAAALIAVSPHALAFGTARPRASAILVALLALGIGGGDTQMRARVATGAHATISHLLPIEESALAYSTAKRFLGEEQLEVHASTLAATTLHCQLALGYLGVAYVRTAQARKNQLLLTGGGPDGKAAALPAIAFTKHALRFMAFTGVPYLLQRTLFE